MEKKVYVVKCSDYDQADAKMTELIDQMGGMSQFVKPGEKIILKVNLLQPAKPEQAVTTHPAVVAAVGRLAKQAGAIPVIADSPGSGYKFEQKTLERFYRTCGMDEAAQQAGIALNRDFTHQAVSFPEGKLIKRFEIITPVIEADGVLNLCKMKTHIFMRMTGAVKNSFGVIPGLAKPGYHASLSDTARFANMLLDLDQYVAPRLSIMDGILAMEGEGPGVAGTPRQVGILLASQNPLALDVVASDIMGLPRSHNPVLLEAEKRGLGPTRIEEVQLVGAAMSDLRIPGYKLPATALEGTGFGLLKWWHKPLVPLFKHMMSMAPRVMQKTCIACGVCRDACPVEAITIVADGRKYAHMDEKKCIRCYCCHEMCPQDAIELCGSFLYRLMHR